MDLPVEAVVAFAGGLLALLSPCSALLLPAFFAYAFGSTGRLVTRTVIFYAGLIAVLVPVGLGLGASEPLSSSGGPSWWPASCSSRLARTS